SVRSVDDLGAGEALGFDAVAQGRGALAVASADDDFPERGSAPVDGFDGGVAGFGEAGGGAFGVGAVGEGGGLDPPTAGDGGRTGRRGPVRDRGGVGAF